MKKLILTVACSLLASGLNAADVNFSDATFSKLLNAPVAAPEAGIPEASRPERAKAGHYVQVSAYVSLNGNGWMPSGDNGGYTSVNLTGWVNFRDSSGQITSNNTYINTSASMWVRPNQYIFETVRPNIYVTLYRNGKIVGSTYISGSISVNGWPGSSYFSLSGSGYLNGSLYVEDEQ